jgi:hypothetical protein
MAVHKYKIGQRVEFRPARGAMPAARDYTIVRLLPPEGEDLLYRIKSSGEPFDRVAKERELSSR